MLRPGCIIEKKFSDRVHFSAVEGKKKFAYLHAYGSAPGLLGPDYDLSTLLQIVCKELRLG
jgi:hypothetical protein